MRDRLKLARSENRADEAVEKGQRKKQQWQTGGETQKKDRERERDASENRRKSKKTSKAIVSVSASFNLDGFVVHILIFRSVRATRPRKISREASENEVPVILIFLLSLTRIRRACRICHSHVSVCF